MHPKTLGVGSDEFPCWVPRPLFRGEMLVLGRVDSCKLHGKSKGSPKAIILYQGLIWGVALGWGLPLDSHDKIAMTTHYLSGYHQNGRCYVAKISLLDVNDMYRIHERGTFSYIGYVIYLR